MNTAHIIIQFTESADGSDVVLNLSHSGGADLQNEQAKQAYALFINQMKAMLAGLEDS